VQLLLLLGLIKMLATSFTVGSGGSAGVFGPTLTIGALLGGAFGRAAQLVTSEPSLDPGAFALVGMATFWGGLAHCPLAALVLTCELAGSYDLLVPLMLSSAVAFVALQNHSLYATQRAQRAAPLPS
jgi:CIC family chloride channel protein